jgi:anti-sigma factor RsiW
MTEHRECREYAPLVAVFLDGQLDAASTVKFDDHLSDCETCRERLALTRAIRGSVRRTVREAGKGASASGNGGADAMRARMMKAMLAEQARGEQAKATRAGGEGRLRGLLGWRTMLPMTSAAALALVWGAVSNSAPSASASSASIARAGFAQDPLADLVAEHSRPVPLDADARNVRQLSRYVGVPVRPPMLSRAGARLVGGRVLKMNNERAAMLQYEVGQGADAQRVSVFIYDPRKIQVGGSTLAPRAIGTAQVQVGQSEGYSVAVTQHDGVGYALASDMDTEASAELAALANDGE